MAEDDPHETFTITIDNQRSPSPASEISEDATTTAARPQFELSMLAPESLREDALADKRLRARAARWVQGIGIRSQFKGSDLPRWIVIIFLKLIAEHPTPYECAAALKEYFSEHLADDASVMQKVFFLHAFIRRQLLQEQAESAPELDQASLNYVVDFMEAFDSSNHNELSPRLLKTACRLALLFTDSFEEGPMLIQYLTNRVCNGLTIARLLNHVAVLLAQNTIRDYLEEVKIVSQGFFHEVQGPYPLFVIIKSMSFSL
jgi:hypothetical protein